MTDDGTLRERFLDELTSPDAGAPPDAPAAGDRDVTAYWRRLVAANRGTLVDPGNPDLLVPGQKEAFWSLAREAHQQWLDRRNLDQNFRDRWPFDRTEQAYFSKQGMVLLYNVYHLAPYAMGQPELVLPYDKLKGIGREQYLTP